MSVVRVHLQDPDGFYESVRDAATASVDSVGGLDSEEREELIEQRIAKIWKGLEEWVEYQEEIDIEFDTTAGTATVVRRADR